MCNKNSFPVEGLVEGLHVCRLDKRDLPWYNNHGRLPGVGLSDCDEYHHNLVNYHMPVCNQPFVNTKSEHSVHLLPCSLSCISNRDRSLLSGVPKHEAMGKNESSSAKSGAALFLFVYFSGLAELKPSDFCLVVFLCESFDLANQSNREAL